MKGVTLQAVVIHLNSKGEIRSALLDLLTKLAEKYGDYFNPDEACLVLEKVPGVAQDLLADLRLELEREKED